MVVTTYVWGKYLVEQFSESFFKPQLLQPLTCVTQRLRPDNGLRGPINDLHTWDIGYLMFQIHAAVAGILTSKSTCQRHFTWKLTVKHSL